MIMNDCTIRKLREIRELTLSALKRDYNEYEDWLRDYERGEVDEQQSSKRKSV